MRVIAAALLIVLIVAIGAGAYYGWFMKTDGAEERGGGRGGPTLVTVAPVAMREFVDAIEAVGTAKANESIDLTAKSTDTIGAINFTDGQKVPKGFVVAEMTRREQSADVTAAKAELAEAEKGYQRIKELSDRGFATKAQLDAAVAKRDSARARLGAMESRVTDRRIIAPFAGVLGLRRVSVGSLVRPGDIITTLDDISIIKLDFTVPEAFLGTLSVGMPVKANVAAYPDRVFQGKVAAIDTRVDPVSRSIAMRAEIANEEDLLRPGMLMTVSLLRNQRQALAVAEQSLVPVENKQFVFVIGDDMTAERREVKIGARQPGFVEILGGLKAGERVVVEGTVRLRPGAKVRFGGDEEENKGGERRRKRGGGPPAETRS